MNSFETEAKSSFEAFWKKNSAANQNDAGVDTVGLDTGMKEFKWGVKKTGDHLIQEYDIEGEEYNQETSIIDMQEFVYMNIFENIGFKPSHACTNCF